MKYQKKAFPFISQNVFIRKVRTRKNKQFSYNIATLWEIFKNHTPNICRSFVRHTGIICCFNNSMCLSVVMVSLHVCRLVTNTPPYAQTVLSEAVVRLLMNDEVPTDLNVQKY